MTTNDEKQLSTREYLAKAFVSLADIMPALHKQIVEKGKKQKIVTKPKGDGDHKKKRRKMAARSNQINRKRCHRWKN